MSSPLPPFKSKHLTRVSSLPNYNRGVLPLLRHASHLATTLPLLVTRLESLTSAFASLTHTLCTFLTANPSLPLPSLKILLRHWFTYFARCNDAQTLLQSGEMRHPMEEEPRFKSRLKECGVRGDGYTRLYKGERYSGVSYDEVRRA